MTVAAMKKGPEPMELAFPNVDCGVRPFGSRVIIQIRTPKTKSSGGIQLLADAIETEQWNTQVGRVVACGPVAFRNRDTLVPWPEGAWVEPGMFVRFPKYGSDTWKVPVANREGEFAFFAEVNDLSLLGEITDDPLKVIAFIS